MPKAKYSRDSKARQKGHQLAPSKMSQKQLMTRFGKKVKKGELAETANYVTRTQAVKRLQISLRDFRRLCILKGIYPRAPPKMPAGSSHRQTYYHVKDVGFLAHEPVLHKFRELKSFMKKVRRAAGKDELTEARHLAANRPVYRIDHLIRERYPRFLDALADIDDALCMVHLFATLPADKPIEAERVHTATRLVREWQHITVRARSLRKAFISVKGYYFQASFHGVPVTWTMPHRFSVPMPDDVDYRILLTFLELYEVQLKFVLFKLYNDHGLAYPPVLDEGADMAGVMLGAVRSARLDRGAMAAAAASSNAVSDEKPEDADEDSDVESDDADTEEEGQGAAKRARAADTADSAEAREAAVTAAARRGMGAVLREAARSGGVEGKAGLRVMAGASVDGDNEDADDDSVAGSVGSLDGDEEMEDAEAEELGRVLVPEVDGEEEDEAQAAASAERRRQAVLRERRGRRLFRGLVVFLNREVPREPFELVVRAFAGRVGWDGPGSTIEADDPRITHHVIDRVTVRAPVPGREYVQPQWIFDSANNRILLPLERYRPGASLPPHLSPFIEDEKEGYVPDYRLELDRLRSAVEVRDGVASGDAAPVAGDADEEDKEMDSEEEEEEAVAAAEALIARGFLKGAGAPEADEDDEDLEGDSSDEEEEAEEDSGDDENDDEEDDEDEDDEEEEETKPAAAASAQSKLRAKRAKARAATEASERARQEEIEMQSMLLSNRKRKDLKLVVRGQSKQKNWVRRMEAKRDAIEEQDEAAKTASKKAAKKPAAAKKASPAAKKASPAAKKASPAAKKASPAAKKAAPAARKASPAGKRNPKRGRA
ncbi:hypothetical protein FNF28_04749 [Cafeteria roenbergensis]|uniref:Pescadillo homolog n=1 Tax=Cafeteria roenbergensis TaxID=33653 RepID=A0A5A8DDN4_CAFRO|nr:hypothetical protein FNF28_04749 [Cafeteria roenbergensis]